MSTNMDDNQEICLRWNNHPSALIGVFDTLLENEALVDCTLAAEGKFLKAHKVVLSACSLYFAALLQEHYDKHPIFILKDVKYYELRAIVDYMYRGEVNILPDQLTALLKTADTLQIKGLSENGNGGGNSGAVGTLEQTKRPRLDTSIMVAQGVAGSREGSCSPSHRRRKVRRRSMENDAPQNSSSSNQAFLQPTSASLTHSEQVPNVVGSGNGAGGSSSVGFSSQINHPLTSKNTDVKQKTESAKEILTPATSAHVAAVNEQQISNATNNDSVLSYDKQKIKDNSILSAIESIEPKVEYDDAAYDETVGDWTLYEDDVPSEELDEIAGTSQGAKAACAAYVWQPDGSQAVCVNTCIESKASNLENCCQKMDEMLRKIDALQAEHRKLPEQINVVMESLAEQSALLKGMVRRGHTTTSLAAEFPIKSKEALENMEAEINEKNKPQYIQAMTSVLLPGGVEKNFKFILSDGVTMAYNINGGQGKESLRRLKNFYGVLIASISDIASGDPEHHLRLAMSRQKKRVFKENSRMRNSQNDNETKSNN